MDSSVALRQAALLLFVVAAYLLLSRRYRVLAHPLSIIVAVTVIGVTVSVLAVAMRGDWAEVPQMAVRSGAGSAMWGLAIGGMYWGVRAVYLAWKK